MSDVKENPKAKDRPPPKPKKRPGRPIFECAACGEKSYDAPVLCHPVLFGSGGETT